jgi:hypothetical protein
MFWPFVCSIGSLTAVFEASISGFHTIESTIRNLKLAYKQKSSTELVRGILPRQTIAVK